MLITTNAHTHTHTHTHKCMQTHTHTKFTDNETYKSTSDSLLDTNVNCTYMYVNTLVTLN